ncbi:MAG TPA: T9SS type A sorting domain-containing protein, partial [Saprospiraceae bacterium]|nr:T9SS type A sorting domain-containing protein [Saprospiraceae bacterium]
EAVGPEGYNIFTYNTAAKVAGVRSKHNNFKTVNLGIGLEMIAVKAVADEIMKRTYDWFHGKITDTEFDNYLNAAMGQNYPNPADKFTVINFGTETTDDFILNIVDLTGKMVMSKNIAKGTSSESINTEALPQGIYQYYLTDGSKVTTAKKLVVIH